MCLERVGTGWMLLSSKTAAISLCLAAGLPAAAQVTFTIAGGKGRQDLRGAVHPTRGAVGGVSHNARAIAGDRVGLVGIPADQREQLAQATPRAIAETYAACETASFNEDCRERIRQELIRRGALTPGEWDAVNGARGVQVGDHAAVVLLRAGVPPSRIAVQRAASPRIERWTYSRPGLFAKDAFVVITDDRVSEVGAGRAGLILPVLPAVW